MRGDFTRWTFDRTKHYSGVLNQQGRVALDADWNEQLAIDLADERAARTDLIGRCGGPQGQAGFDIVVAGSTLNITAGRYYVAGIRVENEQTVAITAQPDLPVATLAQVAGLAANATLPAGVYLAYLDVWERHVTALEDAAIREVALGGPDTTTRLQVMAQVKLLRVGDPGATFHCATPNAAWDALLAGSSGMLEARAEPDPTVNDPCVVPAQAGYRGLENQLYRVEVHRIVSATRIALKWSRENGSVAVGWSGQDPLNPNRLIVASTGRDEVLGLAPNQWVELTDDARDKRGEPGLLVKLLQVEGNIVTIDPGGQAIAYSAFGPNPKLRRWDMPADTGELIVTTNAAAWTDLEQGVQIRLKNGTFRPGDYWLIPARTVTGDIEWPRSGNQPAPQPPHGIHHAYCKLALLDFNGSVWTKRSDCRRLFPPLTELIQFYAVGGDGQEALPGATLAQPLQVAVANGQQPVTNARVRFRIVPQTAAGQLTAGGATGKSVDVTAGPNGIYSCQWQLGPAVQSQRVEAFLVEIDGKPFLDSAGEPVLPRVFFNANLSRASHVAYQPGACPDLANARTVQEALDILCQRPRGGGCCVSVGDGGEFPDLETALKELLARGERRICLCLRAGRHAAGSIRLDLAPANEPFVLEIKGCGPATSVRLGGPLWLRGFDSVALRNLALDIAFIPEAGTAALSFDRCLRVIIADCAISGFTLPGRLNQEQFIDGSALVAITGGDDVRLSDNTFTAAVSDRTFPPLRNLFAKAQIPLLADLFADERLALAPEWHEPAVRAAGELARLTLDQRALLLRALQELLREMMESSPLAELLQLQKLIFALNQAEASAVALIDILFDLRAAAVKSRPGAALMLHQRRAVDEKNLGAIVDLLDEDDLVVLEHNRIDGIVSLYGMPAPVELVASRAANLLQLDQQPNEPGGSRMAINAAYMGTVQLRGNHLVSLSIGFALLEEIVRRSDGEATFTLNDDVCARLLLDGNVIEGIANLTLSRNLIAQANSFTAMAAPRSSRSITGATAAVVAVAAPVLGWCLADAATFIGNQGSGQAQHGRLFDISRFAERVANLFIQIT
ncbi:hypothetical protein A6A03_05180 [Chloroflexus islandicus]|uniref:Uncharacterized protein n=1 Tax=Chloroflexus islandicus TaxID=1707952 RepID=A0A178LVJ6_9CHLR|nr:DUF6519 domain-containing protein [Chloroflexus islandicus]OAN38283.1 hypothetical protein A6A03_05180 [Chloroflexus islandicus]